MGQILIVSKADELDEYLKIAAEYDVSFEINDFYEPKILDDEIMQNQISEMYLAKGLPKKSTMHGAFYDLAPFSEDLRIREMSHFRMIQSMEIARKLKLEAVVFHTNYNPCLTEEGYVNGFVEKTAEFLKELLLQYPEINIYLENMFDRTPDVLKGISHKLKEYSNFGICLDWAHASIYGDGLNSFIAEIAEYVKHIHMNDHDGVNDLHLPVGDGKTDWQQFVECYNTYWKNCSILVETNMPKDIRKSLDYLQKLL